MDNKGLMAGCLYFTPYSLPFPKLPLNWSSFWEILVRKVHIHTTRMHIDREKARKIYPLFFNICEINIQVFTLYSMVTY